MKAAVVAVTPLLSFTVTLMFVVLLLPFGVLPVINPPLEMLSQAGSPDAVNVYGPVPLLTYDDMSRDTALDRL
jgi:hypothetical protein